MTIRQVFLSSTTKDLQAHRDAVYEAIEGLDGYHCVRMEDFGARDWESDEFCRQRVTKCDVLVCIVGHLYGSTPPHSDQSYTEREYQVAVDADMPRLIFLAPEDFPLAANLHEPDAKWQRQRDFRNRVSLERQVDTFGSPEDLKARLIQAIRNWEQEGYRARTSTELTDSQPKRQALKPDVFHPYPLERNFTGRFAERRQISDWLLDESKPILAIIGIGGTGKSAMTWAWLQHDFHGHEIPGSSPELYMHIRRRPDLVSEESRWTQYGQSRTSEEARTRRPGDPDVLVKMPVFWWSFSELGSDFGAFVSRLIKKTPEERRPNLATISERVEHVVEEFTKNPSLLILDGFERELRAYKRSEHYRDGEVVRQTTEDYRCCVLPEAGGFLRRLTGSYSGSKVIITSQFLPAELEGYDGQPLLGCQVMNLNGLDRNEALLFMRHQGVNGSETKIEERCRWFDYHPLSLRLISGRIVHDLRRPGDIMVIQRNAAMEMVGREYRGVSVVYNDISSDLRTLLGYLSGLDLPINYQRLEEIATEHEIFEGGEELDGVVGIAIKLGLVTRDMETNQYGMHPVIRAYIHRKFEESIVGATSPGV